MTSHSNRYPVPLCRLEEFRPPVETSPASRARTVENGGAASIEPVGGQWKDDTMSTTTTTTTTTI